MIQVLVCDDHQIVRQGIRQILADLKDVRVAAEAGDGIEAIRLIRDANGDARIDLVLLDIAMPGRDGLQILRQLKAEFPALAVLMLSTYPDRQYAVRSIRLGAAGYLSKSADADQMITAIRRAASGRSYISPATAELLACAVGRGRDDPFRSDSLSPRELQVFRLLTAGRSVTEIASELCLSPNTISTYRARLLEKTGTRNDVELALYSVRGDLCPDGDAPRG